MSARRHFIADLQAGSGGPVIAQAEGSAWNSTIRASEAKVREIARAEGQAYTGDDPEVWGLPGQPGAVYRRTWRNARGQIVRVQMKEVHS